MISVFGNTFDEKDIEALQRVLQSHLVGLGKITTEFEQKFSQKIGFNNAVATTSCTSGFWLLFNALKLGDNAEVIIPNIHFYGIKNVLQLCNLKYVITDVDPTIPNIRLKDLKEKITPNTKAIIFLEYGGYPVEIQEIKDYLQKIHRSNIWLILDAANSPFTKINGNYTAKNYDIALYSYDINKILVTGDGGMVLSNQEHLISRIKSLSFYGIKDLQKSGFEKSQTETAWWETNIETPSIKLSMNNLTAALGLTQLEKIESFLQKRQEILGRYLREFQILEDKGYLDLPSQDSRISNNFYLFWIKTINTQIRNALAKYLLENDIYSTVKYQPLDPDGNTPNAFDFWERSLCLPFNQNLTQSELDHIVKHVKGFFGVE